MKKYAFVLIFALCLIGSLANADEGPTNHGNTPTINPGQITPANNGQENSENLTAIAECKTPNKMQEKIPNPFFTVKNGAKEFRPQVWLAKINLGTCIAAIGEAKINPLIITGLGEENSLNPEDVQHYAVAKEALADARKKMRSFFPKFFSIDIYGNKLYYNAKTQTVYIMVMAQLPAKFDAEIYFTGAPAWLKSPDGHRVALVVEGKEYGGNFVYGLGMAEVKGSPDKALDRAEKNAVKILGGYLGLKEHETLDRFQFAAIAQFRQIKNFAWVIGKIRM